MKLRPLRGLWIVALSGAVAWAQDAPEEKEKEKEKKQPRKTAAEIDIGVPGAKIESASAARREATRFEKRIKEARKDNDKKIGAARGISADRSVSPNVLASAADSGSERDSVRLPSMITDDWKRRAVEVATRRLLDPDGVRRERNIWAACGSLTTEYH